MQEDDLHIKNVAEFRICPLVKYVYFVSSMTTVSSGLMPLSYKPDEHVRDFLPHRSTPVPAEVVSAIRHTTRDHKENKLITQSKPLPP